MWASTALRWTRFTSTSTVTATIPANPGDGATRVCHSRVSTRWRAKNTMIATPVSTIRTRMLTVASPDIHVNRFSTGSLPARTNTARMTTAEADCVSEPMCGEPCLRCVRADALTSQRVEVTRDRVVERQQCGE
jgi:hypothetical protein